MPWKTSRRKKSYWRIRVRHGKRIRRYVGIGLIGRLAEESDALARERRKQRQAEARAWLANFQTFRNRLKQIDRQLEMVLRAALLVAGAYFRNRHEWRLRMHPAPTKSLPPISSKATLHEVAERANAGDQEALQQLRTFLRSNPQLAKQIGNVAAHAQQALLQRLDAVDCLAGEAARVALDELRQELLPPQAGPIHRLAVERVTLSYLEIYLLDAMYPLVSELEPQQARTVAKAKDSAQRRYASALKTFAAVIRIVPTKKHRQVADERKPVVKSSPSNHLGKTSGRL